jgi:hypothetical protein
VQTVLAFFRGVSDKAAALLEFLIPCKAFKFFCFILFPLFFLASILFSLYLQVSTIPSDFEHLMGIALYAGYFPEWYQLLLTEWLLTTLFLLNFLMCSVDTSENLLAPLAIGLSVSLSVFGM